MRVVIENKQQTDQQHPFGMQKLIYIYFSLKSRMTPEKKNYFYTLSHDIQTITSYQSCYKFHAFEMAWLILLTITKGISGNIDRFTPMNRFLILPACITSALHTFKYLL
jgi:hypothetical protein